MTSEGAGGGGVTSEGAGGGGGRTLEGAGGGGGLLRGLEEEEGEGLVTGWTLVYSVCCT